ncbi:allophanate hydrolase-related protein [Amycolatopsis vancoresmycina]|uniref:Amidase n=1 Tax=Amycolatopsis vancoresmycina DSM 44592 TaxID=1292037 RepID=R1I6R3_9PSEU|nr:amidase family protein [Amycolatopsis vancoresmycina]EOD68211.1 amidase [Amycolatopsis vancoresmycina DSM 44592]
MTTLPPDPDPVPTTPPTASQRVIAAFERLTEAGRPDLWTTLRAVEDVLVDAKAVDERVTAGETLPLAGTVIAVEDRIDVAKQPSAHGVAETSAPVVARLTSAGAVVLGKTGSGPLASAWDRTKVGGDGAAVAVALGVVDLALSTGGAVPAALNAVAAVTPTPGLLPADKVSVYAKGLVAAHLALTAATGGARTWPADVRLGAGEHPRIAYAADLPLGEAAALALKTVVARLIAAGAILTPVSVAEPGFDGFDALVVPTVPDHPGIAEALGDPAGVRHRLAACTAFANLLDVAAVTVPVLPGDRRPFGVTFLTRAFEDQIALDLATVCTDEPMTPYPEPGEDLVVFGAHLRGQPLNAELTGLGARFTGPVRTIEAYRMVLLPTEPPQPGVLPGGGGLDGERWRLSPAAFERFAATLKEPFVLDRVELDDGTAPLAVRCLTADGPGLDRYESWRGYVRFASTAGLRGPG